MATVPSQWGTEDDLACDDQGRELGLLSRSASASPTPFWRPCCSRSVPTRAVCTYRDGMVTETAAGKPLTDLERRLVDYATRGELLDLAGREPVDEAAMRSWDSTRTVRAVVLRDILRGRLAPN